MNPKRQKQTNSQGESLKSIQMTNTELSHSFRIRSIIECFGNYYMYTIYYIHLGT